MRERFDGDAPSEEEHVEQGESILRAVKVRHTVLEHAARHLAAVTTLARLAALAGLVRDREGGERGK